jgi:hypothetical protein
MAAGTLAEGAACTVGGSSQCRAGLACRRTSSSGNAGICARMCNPWSSVYECPSQQLCNVAWPRTGLCTSPIERSTIFRPFQQCTTPGAMCDDAVRCFAANATTNLCLKYCRPEANDCHGVSTSDGRQTVCDRYFFYGMDSIGICWPGCSSDAQCSNPERCHQGLCRVPCAAGQAVRDCCGGASSCRAECVDGYCQ